MVFLGFPWFSLHVLASPLSLPPPEKEIERERERESERASERESERGEAGMGRRRKRGEENGEEI